MKQKGFVPILILLIVLVIGGIVGGIVYFGGKTKQPISAYPQPTSFEPQVSIIPTTSKLDKPSDWKTYTNTRYKFSFNYPADASIIGDAENIQADKVLGQIISVSGPNLDLTVDFASDSLTSSLIKSDEKIAVNNIVWVIRFIDPKGTCPPGLGPCIPILNYQTSIKDNLITFTFKGMYEGRTIPNQILSTFRFTDQTVSLAPSPTPLPVTSTKQLTYTLPSGWKTVQDKARTVEIGYNPQTNEPSVDYASGGIAAVSKWEMNPVKKLGGNYTAAIGPYDGGSRHTNLYKGLSLTPEMLQTGDWKAQGYFEKEYVYNGWSCLVLFGFEVSQSAQTQGMCVISGSKAVYFSAETKDVGEVEKFIQTIKIL